MTTTEAIRNTLKARFFAATLLMLSLCAAAGYARPNFAGSFTLPFEVYWGKNIVPAGNYRIVMDELKKVAMVRSTDGAVAFFTPVPIKVTSKGGATALVVTIHGNERKVRALNLPNQGYSLVFQPETRAERELLAKADRVVTVPLGDNTK